MPLLNKRLLRSAAATGLLLVGSGPLVFTQPAPPRQEATQQDFERWMKELSNWGRWGKDDQMGAANLITQAKRKEAVRLVKDGFSVSMARNAETVQAVDNPEPIVRASVGTGTPGAGSGPSAEAFVSDSLFIAYHGLVHTHMDSLCHFFYKGQMYNGYSRDEYTAEHGAAKNGILNWKNGFVTRGVLVDIPRLKGVEYLEPGTRIYPEDLDAWEKKAHVKVSSGDVVLIRTGRWARRDAKGAWPPSELAGLYITCAKWLHSRDVAVLGGDDAQDVMPSGVAGVAQPIHELVLIAMGMPIFDNCDLEQVSKEAAKRNRWEFLLTASPAAVPNATGSVLNPIATF